MTVKARMQAGQVEGRSYSSSLDGVRKIVQTDGLAGLYRGIGPKLTQSVATVRALTSSRPLRPVVDDRFVSIGGHPVPREGEDLSSDRQGESSRSAHCFDPVHSLTPLVSQALGNVAAVP